MCVFTQLFRKSYWGVVTTQILKTKTFINICEYLLFGGVLMTSKNITLKVNAELYAKFRELCKKEGWIVSRQFEKCMEATLKERGLKNGK